MTEPTLADLQAMIRAAGGRNSAADWEDQYNAYAFSVDSCGPATYGHPRFTAHYCKETGWVTPANGRAYKVS